MDFIVNRRGVMALRDQLIVQFKLKILAGELAEGRRLPSVRSLARRLKVHPNTVAAAYKELGLTGNIKTGRGVGVFAHGAPAAPQDKRTFAEMLEAALQLAFRLGFSGTEIRAAVDRWIASHPPDCIVVVDASQETAELLRDEIRRAVNVRVLACTLDDATRDPTRLCGALIVTLPFYVDRLNALVANIFLITLRMQFPQEQTLALPAKGKVLFVSHSPQLFPYVVGVVDILRGSDVTLDCRVLDAREEWEPLARVADTIFVDVTSAPAVHRIRSQGIVELQLLTSQTIAEIRSALALVQPSYPAKKEAVASK
jgi:DNA-binding transcriptional regulator YhcF (GntR family)